MNAELERLIALQRLDSEVAEARRRMAEAPDRERAFDDRLNAVRHTVDAAKQQLTDSQTARRAIEKDVAVHQGRLSKFRDQLMSVKTNIEYQAMQKEIEFAQTEVKSLEDKILEHMLEADDFGASLKRAETALQAEEARVAADRTALAAELSELTMRVERLTSERGAIAGALNPRTLATFDLVSRRRNGVALAEARDGICTICHVRLRPQVFNTVRRNDDILQCDSCNRILYFVPVPAPSSASADSIGQTTS